MTLEEFLAGSDGPAELGGEPVNLAVYGALLDDLLDGFPDAVYIKDVDSRFLWVNRTQALALGIADPSEAIGKTDFDFFGDETARGFRADDVEVMRSGKPLVDRSEWVPRGRDLDGEWVSTTKAPLRGEEGEIIGLVGITRGLREREAAAAALESRVRALTSPTVDVGDLSLTDLFDLRDIQRLQDVFADATGVASVITETDGTPITTPSRFCRLCSQVIRGTEKGLANCMRSDAELGKVHPGGPIVQHCMSGGLWDAGASIRAGDRHIANWLIGQVLDENHDEKSMLAYAREIGADEDAFASALSEVTRMSRAQFGRVAQAVYVIAEQLSLLALRNLQQARHIAERTNLEEQRQAHLGTLENLDHIDAALRGAMDLNQSIEAVIETLLRIMEADRAWILDPCDPSAETWSLRMARGVADYPVPASLDKPTPVTPWLRDRMRDALDADGPCMRTLTPEDQAAYDPEGVLRIRSVLWVAVRPKLGPPWMLGLHQCSHAREWSDSERWFFQEAARRIGDALSVLVLLENVRESEQRLRLILDSTSDGVWDWDLETGQVWWSPQLCRFFAAEPEDAFRHIDDIRAMHHPDDLEETFALVEEHLAGRTSRFERDTRLRGYDGEYRWVRLRGGGVDPGSDGRPRRIVGTVTDIAASVRAEEERRKLEQQIQETQKLESLGLLAGGIAHDFNNMLMGVLGNASLALTELPEGSEARESVERIETAALRAAELAKQMLAYSGKGRFIIQPLDLSALVEEMRRLLASSISKKATLSCDLAKDLPSVEGDATQLRQIIMNLMTNASEALEDEPGVITIRTGVLEAPSGYEARSYVHHSLPQGRCAFVEVSDTGCGMDEETQRRLFDPFFTTKVGGRGLGMAAVLGIVRGHQGALSVYSEPGKGTRIKVVFPCVEEAAAAASTVAAPEADAGWRGSGAILVVDDEASVRQVARLSLERRGFAVLEACDGVEGVSLFAERQAEIAAVILDMTMPRMGGEEAFERIRSLRADVPVLLSSGFNEQDAVGRAVGLGLAGFIQKPYRPSELLAKVREIVGAPLE